MAKSYLNDKKRSGIWFIALPILLVSLLIFYNQKSGRNSSDKKDEVEETSESKTQETINMVLHSDNAIQKTIVDSEMQGISYAPKTVFVKVRRALLYNKTDFSQRLDILQFNQKVYHTAQKREYVFCHFTNTAGNEDSAWILQSDLAVQEEMKQLHYNSFEEQEKRRAKDAEKRREELDREISHKIHGSNQPEIIDVEKEIPTTPR